MTSAAGESRLTQAAFARRRGVSRKAVTDWKTKGLLVISDDGLVDVEQSEWNLDQRPAIYRGGVTHRPIRASGNKPEGNKPAVPPRTTKPARARPAEPQPADDTDDPAEELDLDSPRLSIADAVRRKENMLGLKHKQQFEKEGGGLVDRAAAVKLFFDTARQFRDAWLSWPARVAIDMADELKVDARMLTTVLTAHVQQHLAELGEPEADLA